MLDPIVDQIVQDLLGDINCEILQQPRYSPDLYQCDFHMLSEIIGLTS